MKVTALAREFIGAAKRDPANKPFIFRRAAKVFAGLANDPRNAHAAKRLTNMALDFAGAATQRVAPPPTTTDFQQLLSDTADAWEQLGDDAIATSNATMEAMAVQRDVAQEKDPGRAFNVSIAPASFHKDATLGRSVTVKFDPTPDEIAQGIHQSQTVAFWQGVKQEAQAMTIDVGTVLAPTPGSQFVGVDINLFATIEYGSDGNRQSSVTFDVGLGRRVTVPGNYISVIAGMGPPAPISLSPPPTTSPISVGASIAAFAAPSAAPVTRTLHFYKVGTGKAAFSQLQEIPLRSTLLLPPFTSGLSNVVGGFVRVLFFSFDESFIISSADYNMTSPQFSPTATPSTWSPLVVPPNAFFVQVENQLGFTADIHIPFQLSL